MNFTNSQFELSNYFIKPPKLGIQLNIAGYDNQRCRILTVISNQIEQLRIPNNKIFSENLFDAKLFISTSLRMCVWD